MDFQTNLSADEKFIIENTYGKQNFIGVGYNPNKLEEILDLTTTEKKFFAKNFISSNFFVQSLYKINFNISPIKFNAVVNDFISENKNLRANFCNVGSRTVKVIKSGSIKPEIVFRNLMNVDKDDLNDTFRNILEADMRRDLDIRFDLLIRFAVFKTDQSECAVLITCAQIISEYFNAEQFFCKVLGIPYDSKPKSAENDLPIKNQEEIRDYWANILKNPPPVVNLPYERIRAEGYRQKAYHSTISADILSDLRVNAQSNRTILTSILQTAWGFMLQLMNHQRDCLFCQILSSNKNSSMNLIPVRITEDRNSTIEQIIRKQFRQLVVSQPYSCVDWSDLENGKKLFNHFLSFKEFKSNELNYVETHCEKREKLIYRNSWNAQGMKLGVYFRYSERNLSLSFIYNEKNFMLYGMERLCGLYKLILQQMLVDWNAKYADFKNRMTKRIEMQMQAEKILPEQENIKIRDFLSQLPILQGRFEGTIDLFADNSEIVTYFEGDRLFDKVLKEKFIFVISGKLVRNVDTGDGWYNPLDVIGKNSFVNPTNFLEKQRLTLSAEVLTEQAELLLISRTVMIEILRKNPEVALSITNYALNQMEKYQMLWLQS